MIAFELYKGKTCEELGVPELPCKSRMEDLGNFLETWKGTESDFIVDYLDWLRKKNDAPKQAIATSQQEKKIAQKNEDEAFADPSYSEMFSDLKDSLKSIAASGVKMVSKEEHVRRYSLCKECTFFRSGRCSVCGCFMKIKSKFAVMSCPTKVWGKENA